MKFDSTDDKGKKSSRTNRWLLWLRANNPLTPQTTTSGAPPRRRRLFMLFGKLMIAGTILSLLITTNTIQQFLSNDTTLLAKKSYLMIVAHADDEALWAGDFLIEHGPETHVVVTSGKSRLTAIRRKEFQAVGRQLGFQPEYLLGKDKLAYTPDLQGFLKRRIRKLVCHPSKIESSNSHATSTIPWNKIITHGPEGEYGHPLHHAVYGAVVDAIQECYCNTDLLHVFHPTMPMKKIKQVNQTEWSSQKIQALDLYTSQKHVVFESFLGWKERIVPISAYNYTLASETCKRKNLMKGEFCRLHKYLDAASDSERQRVAKDFHLLYEQNGEPLTQRQGKGCRQ